MRHDELINGQCKAPKQIEKLVNNEVFNKMFTALWHNFLIGVDKTTSTVYWSEQFNDNKAFNLALQHLSQAGWIHSEVLPGRNWATIRLNGSKLLKWISPLELKLIRKEFKFNKYKMDRFESLETNTARTPLGTMNVGIKNREHSVRMGNSAFTYDSKYIVKYKDLIVENTTKSITKAIKKHNLVIDGVTDYKSISEEIVDYYIYDYTSYTMGNNVTDSRGRAIREALSKVGNPIGYKDFRSLVVAPSIVLTIDAYKNIALFVAELLGKKAKSVFAKTKYGRKAIANKTLPKLNADTLHEYMWLERIYEGLENYTPEVGFTVPIEIDATASVAMVAGVLLNDSRTLDETNVIGIELKDIWSKGIPRKLFKLGATPALFGSSASCTKLWKKAGVEYTADDVKIFNEEMKSGSLSVVAMLKDFIIDNVVPRASQKVKVWDEEFAVYCNKFHTVGEYTAKYPLYDTASAEVRTVSHTHTERIPDLEAFTRYFVTLLVHGIDPQLMEYGLADLDWGIDIYDAIICTATDATKARAGYCKGLNKLKEDRVEVLANYFESIGIDMNKKATAIQWAKLQEAIVQAEDYYPNSIALK